MINFIATVVFTTEACLVQQQGYYCKPVENYNEIFDEGVLDEV